MTELTKDVMNVLAILVIVGLLGFVSTAKAEDCTNDGKHSRITCYGIQHGMITAGGIGLAYLVDPQMVAPAAGLACAGFFTREAVSDSGAFGSTDDILDWVTPCVVGIGIVYADRESVWYPWFDDDVDFGVGWIKQF